MTRRSATVQLDLSEIAGHRLKDYAIRFCFGAGISLGAALIGMKFGTTLGGVFLAFPAILPASLTLIERKKGKHVAAIDAEGAILGGIALVAFALVARATLGTWTVVPGVGISAAVWLIIAVGLYLSVMAWHHKAPSPP